MRLRSIIFYWLLLLIPTAIIGAVAFQALRHEQDRQTQRAKEVAANRAATLADSLQYTVATVEEEMTQALRDIPPADLAQTLLYWQRRNPLVRNAFIWEARTGLVLPTPGPSATAEEQQFMRRYQALISGRIPWQSGSGLSGSDRPMPRAARAASDSTQASFRQQQSPAVSGPARPQKRGRESLVNLAKGTPAIKSEAPSKEAAALPEFSGWMPWFAENRLYILGWVRLQPEGSIFGVELEVMTLLSRLVSDFPTAEVLDPGITLALVDGNGHILHQAGAADPQTRRRADIAISLAPQLPHWQIAVYFSDQEMTPHAGSSFLLLSSLLLAIFIVAIMAGGALLTWQAYRNNKDARQKTTFVSNVSHELKTPLTSIRMYAELLSQGRVISDEKKNRYLDVIVSESQRLTRLVNNVLDFSRLEQGRKTYQSERLDLAELLRETIASQRIRILKAGLTVETRIPAGTVVVQADRDALGQVLLNLIDNALKYASDGQDLTVTLTTQKTVVLLTVADRGPGIPTDHRDKIFRQFHRIDDSLTTQHPGSGLGLSIARRLIKDMGGHLYHRPRGGGGSCFVVELPVPTGDG